MLKTEKRKIVCLLMSTIVPLELVEVCLIANLQSIGPVYVADTAKEIFDSQAGNLLAARLIITAGM